MAASVAKNTGVVLLKKKKLKLIVIRWVGRIYAKNADQYRTDLARIASNVETIVVSVGSEHGEQNIRRCPSSKHNNPASLDAF